jgi:hypothetical protein
VKLTKKITCPETGHLEEVALESTPCGMLVLGCSRLEREDRSECPRECTRRLDQRARRESGRMALRGESVLLVIARLDGGAPALIANVLAAALAHESLNVEVALSDGDEPPPSPHAYAGVILGGIERYGDYAKSLVAYARAHRTTLDAMPSAFFALRGSREALGDRIEHLTGWHPIVCESVDAHAGPAGVAPFVRAFADLVPARPALPLPPP